MNSQMEDILLHKNKIDKTYNDVREFSFDEKRAPLMNEKKINLLLDSINNLKKKLSEKTVRLKNLNKSLESLTWFTEELDMECLMKINDIISASKDLHSSLIRQYTLFNIVRTKGIAKNELKEFKGAVNDLKEISNDIESVFFILPEIEGFKETAHALSLL